MAALKERPFKTVITGSWISRCWIYDSFSHRKVLVNLSVFSSTSAVGRAGWHQDKDIVNNASGQ